MRFGLNYLFPSEFDTAEDAQSVNLAANGYRPVAFHGEVRPEARLAFRHALSALGQLAWRFDDIESMDDESGMAWFISDPVVTVHPDVVIFESLSQNLGLYGRVCIDRSLFEEQGDAIHGTTNVDFTAMLSGALGEMRSSRRTVLKIGTHGIAVETAGQGGRFEKKIDIPRKWVRAFSEVQAASAMVGTCVNLRPIDLLSVIWYLRKTKGTVSPRALRYELDPDAASFLFLEPWDLPIQLRANDHTGERRTIRVWGRQHLRILEPILCHAHSVTAYLKGRAMPHFYSVELHPGIRFLLGITGWTGKRLDTDVDFGLMGGSQSPPEHALQQCLQVLESEVLMNTSNIAASLRISTREADAALTELCRRGRCFYEVETRRFRHRELFAEPIDMNEYFPASERRQRVGEIIARGKVTLRTADISKTTKEKKVIDPRTGHREPVQIVYTDWEYRGAVDDQGDVLAKVNDDGRLIFGTCRCRFFQDNLMAKGPCEHIAALRIFGEMERQARAGGADA